MRPSVHHTSLQKDVYGGVEPWWAVGKGKTLVTKGKTLVTKGKTLVTKGKEKSKGPEILVRKKFVWKQTYILMLSVR